MAKVTEVKHTVTFKDETWLSFEMSDDGDAVYLRDGCDTFSIPRDELEEFAGLLCTWAAEHPTTQTA